MMMFGGRIIVTFELWEGKASLSVQLGSSEGAWNTGVLKTIKMTKAWILKSKGSLKVILKLYWGHLIF